MVSSFRVSELQLLLQYAGRSKTGKKHEMMTRAISLVDKGCSTPIQIKIRELHRRRYPSHEKTVSGEKPKPLASVNRHAPYPTSSSYYGGGSSGPLDFSSTGSLSSTQSSPQLPTAAVHPDVRMKRLPFYDTLGELLRISSLVPTPGSRMQEGTFVFHLTPLQVQEIVSSRNRSEGSYAVQIQLRFALSETTCEQKDEFPPTVCVRVNGRMATLPNPIPTNKPGVEAKRPGRPVNITDVSRLHPTAPNQISVTWSTDPTRLLQQGFCLGVWLVRQLSSDILLSRIKMKGAKHPDHTRALIKEKLATDPDSEIATTSLRVSLLCPLGKMRMTTPCRASSCTHLQCFDGPTFLQMNERKPTWQCPVCDQAADFDVIAIDGYFSQAIQQVDSDCTEVKLLEDGNWRPMKAKENRVKSPLPVTTIGVESPSHGAPSPSPPDEQKPKSPRVECIDLTESGDEGDDALSSSSTEVESNAAPEQASASCRTPPLITLDSPRDSPGSVPSRSPFQDYSRPQGRLFSSSESEEKEIDLPKETARRSSQSSRGESRRRKRRNMRLIPSLNKLSSSSCSESDDSSAAPSNNPDAVTPEVRCAEDNRRQLYEVFNQLDHIQVEPASIVRLPPMPGDAGRPSLAYQPSLGLQSNSLFLPDDQRARSSTEPARTSASADRRPNVRGQLRKELFQNKTLPQASTSARKRFMTSSPTAEDISSGNKRWQLSKETLLRNTLSPVQQLKREETMDARQVLQRDPSDWLQFCMTMQSQEFKLADESQGKGKLGEGRNAEAVCRPLEVKLQRLPTQEQPKRKEIIRPPTLILGKQKSVGSPALKETNSLHNYFYRLEPASSNSSHTEVLPLHTSLPGEDGSQESLVSSEALPLIHQASSSQGTRDASKDSTHEEVQSTGTAVQERNTASACSRDEDGQSHIATAALPDSSSTASSSHGTWGFVRRPSSNADDPLKIKICRQKPPHLTGGSSSAENKFAYFSASSEAEASELATSSPCQQSPATSESDNLRSASTSCGSTSSEKNVDMM